MSNYCHSCAAPLTLPENRGAAENLCRDCADENGKLKSRSEVQSDIANWLQSWQTGLSHEIAMKRAEAYMRAMPVWAESH